MLNAVIRAMSGAPSPGVTTLAGRTIAPGEGEGQAPSVAPTRANFLALFGGLRDGG